MELIAQTFPRVLPIIVTYCLLRVQPKCSSISRNRPAAALSRPAVAVRRRGGRTAEMKIRGDGTVPSSEGSSIGRKASNDHATESVIPNHLLININ
jgi:hypothetical protein